MVWLYNFYSRFSWKKLKSSRANSTAVFTYRKNFKCKLLILIITEVVTNETIFQIRLNHVSLDRIHIYHNMWIHIKSIFCNKFFNSNRWLYFYPYFHSVRIHIRARPDETCTRKRNATTRKGKSCWEATERMLWAIH